MDYFIIAITTVAGLAFHAADHSLPPLGRSRSGIVDCRKRPRPARLDAATSGRRENQKVKRRDLQGWLEQQAQRYPDA